MNRAVGAPVGGNDDLREFGVGADQTVAPARMGVGRIDDFIVLVRVVQLEV